MAPSPIWKKAAWLVPTTAATRVQAKSLGITPSESARTPISLWKRTSQSLTTSRERSLTGRPVSQSARTSATTRAQASWAPSSDLDALPAPSATTATRIGSPVAERRRSQAWASWQDEPSFACDVPRDEAAAYRQESGIIPRWPNHPERRDSAWAPDRPELSGRRSPWNLKATRTGHGIVSP